MNTTKRVFIGIKADLEVIQLAQEIQERWSDLPVRWVHREDLHLTLIPPWETTETDFIKGKIKTAVESIKAFEVKLNHLDYGPKPQRPRMIWAGVAFSKELEHLKESLEEALETNEERKFLPHITLARFAPTLFRQRSFPPLTPSVSLMMKVTSVELFQSHLQNIPRYQVLHHIPFRN